MTARHTVEPDDQRVPVEATDQRRGMYMRAEARRAAELGAVVTTTAPKRRATPRRIQLAALATLWLLIAAVTAVIGFRWAREDRTSPPPVVASSPARPAVAEPAPPKPTPTPVAAAAPVSVPPAAAKAIVASSAAPIAKLPSTRTPLRAPAAPTARPAAVAGVAATTGRLAVRRASVAAPRLVVTSSPPGAFVTVDGIGWGATPARVRYLPPGTKHVRVTKDGYASQEATIRVGDSGTTTLNVLLRREGR